MTGNLASSGGEWLAAIARTAAPCFTRAIARSRSSGVATRPLQPRSVELKIHKPITNNLVVMIVFLSVFGFEWCLESEAHEGGESDERAVASSVPENGAEQVEGDAQVDARMRCHHRVDIDRNIGVVERSVDEGDAHARLHMQREHPVRLKQHADR